MPFVHRPVLLVLALLTHSAVADDRDRLKIGVQPDGRILVPTNQILQPAGKQVTFPGRPVDLLLIEDDKTLVAKNMRNLVFIDVATGAIKQTLALPAAAKGLSGAFSAVGLVAADGRILATDSQNAVRIAKRNDRGSFAWDGHITLKPPAVGGAAYPTGMTLANGMLWVCSSRGNEVQVVNLDDGADCRTRARRRCPIYADRRRSKGLCFATGAATARSARRSKHRARRFGIDPKTNVANNGSVSVIERVASAWKTTRAFRSADTRAGWQPRPRASSSTSPTPTATRSVSSTQRPTRWSRRSTASRTENSRSAAARTPSRSVKTARPCSSRTEPATALPSFGWERSRPRGVWTGQAAWTALFRRAGIRARFGSPPTASGIYVANVKGHGALQPRKVNPKRKKGNAKGDGDDPAAPQKRGKNSHDHLGSVSLIRLPDADGLKKYTATVNANNRLSYSLAGLEKPRPDAKPIPVPERHGEPSVFQHVIYVIKENRTFDQVLGDMKEGNGDKELCIFGAEVTPNHHKLGREFVLLDNFYCSGVLSADGHSWTNAAYVTDYLEKQFGQFVRSYPYEGSDPLAFPTTGFLWDNALARSKTFRNYGEFVKSSYEPKNSKWGDLYADFANGTNKVKITAKPNLRSLDKYSHPNYPGFPLITPDVYRARLFIKDLKQLRTRRQVSESRVPISSLRPHNGTRPSAPTPRAMVADNDLALGMVVEAVSKSKFWPKTCIVVTEDDPQNGFDHVDGHRTVGLVISPYTKRKAVDSTCYNQTGMVKTIELILGLPPMTQLDLSATPMRNCFSNTPDLTPYVHVKNNIPLDEMNKPARKLKGKAKEFALKSMELDFDEEDKADEDTLNRILWFAMRGDQPFPGDR